MGRETPAVRPRPATRREVLPIEVAAQARLLESAIQDALAPGDRPLATILEDLAFESALLERIIAITGGSPA